MNRTPEGSKIYRGRFAPSPTGPLHFGSLVAAVASYLDALAQGGEWLVRIEDIDPTREEPGATDRILRSLKAHGFEFAPPLMQSSRLDAYEEILAGLVAAGHAYPCSCTRKEIRATARTGLAGPVYAGTCRNGADTRLRDATSVRLRVDMAELEFEDRLQGRQRCRPEHDIGDFLLRRGDGLIAYQLAVVVDDHCQQITDVVRGTDLLEPTFMQVALQQTLGYPRPGYLHVPVAVGPDNAKLSKQTGAPALDDKRAAENLMNALRFLKQNIDCFDNSMKPKEILYSAAETWQPGLLHGVRTLPIGV